MSLIIAQDLLKQYNKNSPYKQREPIASQADQHSKKFGTWSYANMYDALYDKFSTNKNFNIDMWHQAIKLGEQDQYLALLEQNKDTTLSNQFYDPQYYDYESMMLELYKPFADATNKTERFQDVYDQATQSWVEESIGEMSDQEYIQYQLNQMHTIKDAKITEGLEQWRKEQLNFWQKLGHDAVATVGEFHEGLLSALAGMTDFVIATGVGVPGLVPYAAAGFKGNYLDAFVDYFGEKSLTALEKQTLRAALDEYERTHTHFRDIDGNITGVGKYFTGIANSIGMMVPAIVANYFTAGTASLAWVGTATFYASIFSSNMYENATNPNIANSPSWLKIGNAALKTAVEAVVEWALSKIFGGTIQNKLLGIGGRNIGQEVIKGFSKTSGIKYFFKSAGQEGLEEFLQDFSTNCVDQFMALIDEGYGNTGVNIQTLIDSFCIGVLSSMLMSTGHIAINETKSAIQNKIKPGSGDLLIETESGPQKVKGFNRLYYSSILSDFQQAVDELKRGKISSTKNIELAQEVYGAMSAISQFYSSFDADRIKNCEMLLDRVVKAEKFKENHERAASILSEKTIKKATKHEVKEAAQTLGRNIETAFRSMVGGVAIRHADKLHSIVEKEEVTTALENGGVTEATGAVDTDGIQYKKDPQMAELEERLGKKAVDTLQELRKGYEWVITTDGHIAVESDGYLFVSEAWLQNYKISDIYKYLEQTRVLQAITTDKTLAPMIKNLVTFDKEFTGQADVDAERAVMDLLFNKSVYQAFLLSNAGKNALEYKNFIFQLHEIIKDLASRSKYHQQLFKGKQAQTRINLLNQIYEQIKETMREPTIKAILNWRLDPQMIGADSVLTERDRQVINQYEQRRRVLNGTNTSRSAYENLVKNIIAQGRFNQRELELIQKSLNGTATIDEDIEARALLDEADRRMTRYDFEVSGTYSNINSKRIAIADEFMHLMESEDTEIEHWKEVMNLALQALIWIDSDLFSDELGRHKHALLMKVYDIYKNTQASTKDYADLINLCIKMLEREMDEIFAVESGRKAIGLGTFTIPYQAAAIAENNPADAQFVTDKLDEFKSIYGISVRQMITGDLTGMSMAQRSQLTQDMEILGFTSDIDIVSFVIKKLEGMLGGKFVVTPTRTQIKKGEAIVKPWRGNINDVKDFTKLRDELNNSREAVNRWIDSRKRSINRIKNEDTAYRAVEYFYDIAYPILLNNYSDFYDFLPDVKSFWQDLSKIWRKDGSIQAVKYIIATRETIDNFYEVLRANLAKAAIDERNETTRSEIYDFAVVKSIPAEQFISHDILNEDIETRNAIFEQMFQNTQTPEDLFKRVFNEVFEYDLRYDKLIDLAKERFSREEINYMYKEMGIMSARVEEAGEDPNVVYGEFVDLIREGINPFTGEVFYDYTTDTIDDPLLAELLHFNLVKDSVPYVSLSKFIDISKFPTINLSDVRVYFEDAGPGNAGWALGNKIVIDPYKDTDHFGTLVHEINHILQQRYNLPNGFNSDTSNLMPDFLAYVANHYPNYIKYTLRRSYYEEEIETVYGKNGDKYITQDYISRLSSGVRKIIAHCAYMLVQGELWARAYDHNGKMVHGFTEIFTKDGNYLLAPDGKAKFKTIYSSSSNQQSTSYMSKIVAGSALDVAIQKVFFLKWEQDKGDFSNTRDTYHSGLTKKASTTLVESIIRSDLSFFEKFSIKLNDIIHNPERYLSPEILAKCNGDFSEGNVFYRVREYVENTHEGISIDIKDGVNPQYIWVDDNAFDDLLVPNINKKRKSDSSTIVGNYKIGERISLSDFYSSAQLAQLGINPNSYIVLSEKDSTETIFDYRHSAGAIVINTNVYKTDKAFINALNHEFRHLLQYYNGFATGFTADFKITTEMLNDIKAHLPGLFKNQEIVNWAKKVAKLENRANYEEAIAARYVYYAASGELEAHGFSANNLSAKPVFVTEEAGNPTIFMSWYNPKTGEGRYQTEYLAMRAEKIDVDTKKKVALPKVNKRRKYAGVKVESLDDVDQVRTYIYDTRRDFTAKKAKGTNLEYFVKKGQRNQMDPDLQDFIIATTGHEDQLPPELVHSIKRGILTKQALFKWFRQVETNKINDFTFDLLNKYIFKNNYITSMAELDALIAPDPSLYWAAAIVLREENLALESLLAENDVEKFLSFINSIEGTKWKTKITKKQLEFNEHHITNSKGVSVKENVAYSDKVQKYMRVLAMQWFDGTLAGAFYVANTFRKNAPKYEKEIRDVISFDAKHGNGKGDKETTVGDKIPNTVGLNGDNSFVANDILAVYENEHETDKSEDEMLQELSRAYYERLCEKADIDPQSKDKDKLRPIAQKALKYGQRLAELSTDEIAARYSELINAKITDTRTQENIFDTDTKIHKKSRISIVDRIKRRGKKLLKYIREGEIAFNDLPKDVQAMFELTAATTDSGKKTEVYELKSSVYSVGRGRNKLPGITDKIGRFNYVPKHNITEGNEAFRHDTSTILANLERLDVTVKAAKQVIAERKGMTKKLVTRGERATKTLIDAIRAEKAPKKEGNVRETEFKTSKKKKRTSDTPNYFTIVSAIDMPHVLYKILDTSFEELADTKVQFASRDENGQLYNKEQFKSKEFDSRVKHEVSNWDAFYEANRTALLALTRSDILDIVEFFQRGVSTLNGPTNKLAAFEIFLLGYIVDGARRNLNNWNFSGKEIEMVEKLYEQKASTHGSGLNAVQQMLKVVDPLKKIRQRMLDDYNITDDELKPLFEAVDKLQDAKDTDTRNARAKIVASELERIEAMMVQRDITERGWGKRWYQKLKSYRYTAMLSSPTTWIRNIVSNVAMLGLNSSADFLANTIFLKKGYRDTQWNLSKVQVSQEVKTFIDENIKNSKLFDTLYDKTTKYDERSKNKNKEQELFITMIVNALEQKYAAAHRFDNKTANAISLFVGKMISDKAFIKFVTSRYLGKILTIEAQKGNVDLSKGLSDEVLNLFAEAVILGNTEYMHKRSFLADMVDSLRDSHPVAYEALTLWQPFINSSFNWFQETLKYTPFGLASAIIRMARLEKQIAKVDARRAKGELVADSRVTEFLIRRDIGKGTLGLILGGLGIILALTGVLKVEDDDDKFYMVVGDVKVDISNIFGMSSVLIGASIAQYWVQGKNGEKDIITRLGRVFRLVGEQMFEGFILNDILARHKWDESFLDGMLTEAESVLRSFVPQFFQLLIRATNNEEIRYSSGMAGMWERWLNSFVPTQPLGNRKVNPYTGEIETKYALPFFGELLKSGILGPKIYWTEVSEAERMCRELKVNKGELTGELTVNDKKFKLDRLALNEKYGELNKESLEKIKSQKHKVEMPDDTFKTLSWDDMSDEQRARVLDRVMVQNADIAKIYIWTQTMNKKFYASDSLWQTLKKLGITRNVYKGDKGFVE